MVNARSLHLMINYRCSRGHEIDVCAECLREAERREEWDEWTERWAAAPDAEFALGSTGTVHRRGSCVLVPETTTADRGYDQAFRDQHSAPMTWPLAEQDAAILLLAKQGQACKLCIPASRPANLRAWMA